MVSFAISSMNCCSTEFVAMKELLFVLSLEVVKEDEIEENKIGGIDEEEIERNIEDFSP